jgi:hypothetical protein
MGRPALGIRKEKFTAYVEIALLKQFKDASYAKTGSFKGISRCLEEAMKDWMKKK